MTALVKAVPSVIRPITFGGFTLTAVGVDVVGRPKFEHFESAFEFSLYAEERAGLWLADLLVYLRSRPEWKALAAHVVTAERLTAASVQTYLSVGKRVPPERRVEGLGIGHVIEVAHVRPSEQKELLEQAKENHWSTNRLRQEVRKAKRTTRILKGQSSEIAAAEALVHDAAMAAKVACAAIPNDDYKWAETNIAVARQALTDCDVALKALRKLTGVKR